MIYVLLVKKSGMLPYSAALVVDVCTVYYAKNSRQYILMQFMFTPLGF